MSRFLIVLSLVILYWGQCEQALLGAKRRLTRDEIHSEEFEEILNSAVKECNREHPSELWHQQDTVSDATKQIVQGTNYEFNVRLKQTKCLKQSILSGEKNASDDTCKMQLLEPHIICSAGVWFRPWLKEKLQVTVRGHWRVTSEKLSISEIQSSPLEQTALAEKVNETITKAIDAFNLHGSEKKVVKYAALAGHFRQSDQPAMHTNEIYMKMTTCEKPTDMDQLKRLKTDPCYTTDGEAVLVCRLNITETLDNATVDMCKPSLTVSGGMWRLTESSATKDTVDIPGLVLLSSPVTQPFTPTNEWSAEPLKIAFWSTNREVPMERFGDSEYKTLLRQLVFAYNARSNSLFMSTLSAVKSIKIQDNSEKIYTVKLQLQETECKKNKGYLDDLDKFEKDCGTLDPKRPVTECEMIAKSTGKPDRPYMIELTKCRRLVLPTMLRLGGKIPVSADEQNKEDFQDLLKRVTEKFNADQETGMIYEIEEANNVYQQVIEGRIYNMNVTFKAIACKLPAQPGCQKEKVQDSYKCDVIIVQGHSGKPGEMVNISNCWHLVYQTTPYLGAWSNVNAEDISSDTFQQIMTRAVKVYNERYAKNSADWELDYVNDVRKLTGATEMMELTLFLKIGDNMTKTCEVTMLSPYEKAQQMSFTNCKPYTVPKSGPGMARPLTRSEVNDEEFLNLLTRVTTAYNKQAENRYFHRFDRIKNPTIRIVSGTMTEFELHVQPTNCLKSKLKKDHDERSYHLCGPFNITHVVVCNVEIWQQKWINMEKITVKSCATERRNVTAHGVVQPGRMSLTTRPMFERILKETTLLINTHPDNKVFYKQVTVENVTLKAEDGFKYTFELGFYSTKCLRETDFVSFMENQNEQCQETENMHAMHCHVTASMKAEPEGEGKITVDSCLYAYPPTEASKSSLRRLTIKELQNLNFKSLEKQAVYLFNQSIESPVTYNVHTVENAVTYPDLGQKVAFDLYMKPTDCRPHLIDGQSKTANETLCNQTIPLHFIHCRVLTWKRPWLQDSRLINIKKCELIHKNRSMVHLGALGAPDRTGINMTYVKELIPRFVAVFNRKGDLSYTYEVQNVEKVKQQIVAGLMITFDLFLKPKAGSSKCTSSVMEEKKCPPENHFYFCKATVWARPWLKSEILDLADCVRVELPQIPLVGVPQPMEVKKSNPKLNEIKERATKLYNEKLAGEFEFGNGQISDAVEQVVAGMMTKMTLRMQPIACKLQTAPNRRCNAQDSRLRVECQVIFWERPWLEESESIALENCRRFYDDGTVANHEVHLSREEEQSADFQIMLGKMANLYKSDIPITYEVEKILNARVKHDSGVRNITFNIILRPSGCNTSIPGGDEPECINWNEQDQVSCEGQISQYPTNTRSMSLRNCRVLWKTESERPLTVGEQQTKWFRQSVRDAMKLYQSSVQTTKLFKLREIESGTLQRSNIELIKYRMILVETECVKDQTNAWDDEKCPETEPPVTRTCDVELKRKPDHSHDLAISC